MVSDPDLWNNGQYNNSGKLACIHHAIQNPQKYIINNSHSFQRSHSNRLLSSKVSISRIWDYLRPRNSKESKSKLIKKNLYVSRGRVSNHANGNTNTLKNVSSTELIIILSGNISFHFITTNYNLRLDKQMVVVRLSDSNIATNQESCLSDLTVSHFSILTRMKTLHSHFFSLF